MWIWLCILNDLGASGQGADVWDKANVVTTDYVVENGGGIQECDGDFVNPGRRRILLLADGYGMYE